MKRRDTLIGRVLAVNVLLVTATLFAASVAAGLDLTVHEQRFNFLLLAMAILLTLCVNMLMLRRRFSPLEDLMQQLESIDPAHPERFGAFSSDGVEEIDRLAASFRKLLRRIDEERGRSGRLVVRAQEEERARVARDLHDEVNQALTAILLRLEALSHDAPPELCDELAELKRLVNQAMAELLQLARQLRPSALDDHGLTAAIDSQVRRFEAQTGVTVTLKTGGDPSALAGEQQVAMYRVAQEALANVARHSDASRVEVEVEAGDGTAALRVEDDGRGFDVSSPPNGLGLNGMAERARLAGGRLTIDSEPGRGTALRLRIP